MSFFSGPRPSTEVTAADLAGRWSFCDDGWPATLTLRDAGGLDLTGTYASERFDEDYRVTGRVGGAEPHAVELVVHEFNWLPEQHYEGFLLTRSRNAIAGRTWWKEQPFGFFATRSPRPPLGTYRAGVARGEDFAGSWTAYLDGEPATVVLTEAEPGALAGTCSVGAEVHDVTGTYGGEYPYAVDLSIGAGAATLTGYLMSRPKNAISGSLTVDGTLGGFIMIRYA